MEKTKYVMKAALEATPVLAKTLVMEPAPYKFGEADATMFQCFGTDKDDRKAWVATFADVEEAQAWLLGCKTFGRPVTGFVMPAPEKKDGNSRVADSDTPATVN